jgi:hypothetical protein
MLRDADLLDDPMKVNEGAAEIMFAAAKGQGQTTATYPEFLRGLSMVAAELKLPFDEVAAAIIAVQHPIPGHGSHANRVGILSMLIIIISLFGQLGL